LFVRAAELNASYAPAYLALGQLAAADRQMGAALEEFDRAVRANPGSFVAVRARAEALVRARRAREAVEFLEATVARDSRNAGFHGLLGTLYAAQREPDKAAEAFRKAIEVDARAVEPRLGLARLALSQGNDKDAIQQLQQAVKEQPDHAAA